MNNDLTKASVTPIDVRCRQPNCPCARSVPGTIVKDGLTVAPEAGDRCPVASMPGATMNAWGARKVPSRRGSPSPEGPHA